MTVTLEELQRQHEEALDKAKAGRAERDAIKREYSQGLISASEYKMAMKAVKKKIKKWSAEATRLADAITDLRKDKKRPPEPEEKDARIMDLLDQIRALDEEARRGVLLADHYVRMWDAIVAQLKELDYPVETLRPIPPGDLPTEIPEPTPEEEEDLEVRARAASNDATMACLKRGVSGWACVNVGKIAYDAVMEGKTDGEALAEAKDAEGPSVGAGAMEAIANMLTAMGDVGTMKPDADMAASLTKPIQDFFTSLGVSAEALEAVKTSPLDREKAAQIATGIAVAAQTGLGLLYSLAVIVEVKSLGQIDQLVHNIYSIITNLGIDEIIKPLFSAPSYAALTIPTRQYWMSVFKPTIPPIQDLRIMAVREAFPVETREEQFSEMARWGAYHGLEKYWGERYLKAGYERMDVRTALDMFYWRLWDEDQLKAFLSIADIHPDDHDSIISTLWRSPTRYERRHGYIMGVYDEEALEEYFHRDGLSDTDSKTATLAMTAYALNAERNAVARAAGRIYRETIEELAEKIGDLSKAAREAIDDVVAMEKDLEEGAKEVTAEDVEEASLEVTRIQAELGGLRTAAATIRARAEDELRTELTGLKISADRQDLWVRRYAMEARIKTRPWELIEGVEPELPFEPER